jgi:excisionase family DNA binding protein
MDTDFHADTDTAAASRAGLEPVLTLSELAAALAVSVQTLYDLRSAGRGPRGFRVGRELRFRRSEVDAWLARLEAADGARPRTRDRG